MILYMQDQTPMTAPLLPDDIAKACLGLRARMAARAVTRAYNARLRPLNLQITQFTLLVSLAQGDDIPIEGLALRLDIEPSALSRNLKLLEARGLAASDGGRGPRGRRLVLTAAGERLLREATPIWAEVQADLARTLDGEADTVRAGLIRLEAAALELERL